MNTAPYNSFSAFAGDRLLASGPMAEVAIAVKIASGGKIAEPITIFDDFDRALHRPRSTRQPPRHHRPVAPATDGARGSRFRTPRPRPPETRRRRPRNHAAAATLGVARHPTGRRFGRVAKTGRGGATRPWRPRPAARRTRRGLSFHVDDGRRLAGLRGSIARFVRRRPAALYRSDRRMARRHPRPHRQACLQRSRRTTLGMTGRSANT